MPAQGIVAVAFGEARIEPKLLVDSPTPTLEGVAPKLLILEMFSF